MIIIMLINIMTIVLIKIIIIIMNNKQNDINNNDKYVEAYKKEYVRWVQKNCDIGTKLPASEKAFHNSSHHMLSMGLGHQSRNLPTGSGNHAKAAAVCQLFQQENDTCDMLQVHTLHQTDSTPWDACKELRWQSFASPPSLPRPPCEEKRNFTARPMLQTYTHSKAPCNRLQWSNKNSWSLELLSSMQRRSKKD